MNRLILPITFKAPAKSKDGSTHIGEFYPTVNHVYIYKQKNKGAAKYINPHAKNYLQEVAWLARSWVNKTGWVMPKEKQKVIVRFWYFFKDGNRCDTHNIPKTILDILQGIVFPNDKWVLIHEADYDFCKENPRLELEFEIKAVE